MSPPSTACDFVIERADPRQLPRRARRSLLGAGDFLLNVSVDVSSVALIELCQQKGALYLDTCIEPWPGGYTDPTLPPSARSNYALRESALALRRRFPSGPTAVVTHGANPGLVSHFVKQALLDLAGLDLAGGAGSAPASPAAAATGRGSPSASASRPSTSPSAIPRWRWRRSSRASSSTPGRSTALSARARSRPSSAGARMSGISRPMAAGTISAAVRRSTCCGPVPRPGCAAGRRSKAPITAF